MPEEAVAVRHYPLVGQRGTYGRHAIERLVLNPRNLGEFGMRHLRLLARLWSLSQILKNVVDLSDVLDQVTKLFLVFIAVAFK